MIVVSKRLESNDHHFHPNALLQSAKTVTPRNAVCRTTRGDVSDSWIGQPLPTQIGIPLLTQPPGPLQAHNHNAQAIQTLTAMAQKVPA